MRQHLGINFPRQRVLYVVVLILFFSVCTRQQETHPSDSFSTLLDIVDGGEIVRERRDVSEDLLAADGSGEPEIKEGAPVIVQSEQKKFVVRTPGKLSVDVGCTVYAARGTEITVACRASATAGTPKIKWFRNGYLVSDRYIGGVAAIDGSLRIRRLGRFNEGTYTCRASNDAGASEALFTAKIVVPSLPTILKVEGHITFGPNDEVAEITIGADATVYRGATLTIRCPVEGPDNPMVFWTSQGRPVIGKAVKVGNDLVISDIDRRYALTFKCNARTHRGSVDAESTVIVEDLDPPSIKHGARDIRIVGNETNEVEIYVGTKLTVISEALVRVRCETSTDPAPAISWEIQGRNSDFKDIVLLSKDNSTLTLSEPRKEDSGVYTCTARNNVGRDSKSSNIEILAPEPPRIQSSNQKITQLTKHEILEAKIGDQLTLLSGVKVIITCVASGLPTPTVQWKKDGEDLSVSGNRLEIKNATTQDTGVFTCEAVNRAGRFSYSSELRVIAGEKPEIESSTGRVVGLQGIEEAVVRIGQDLRVVEGLIVRLVCPVIRGFPTPQVTWFLNDQMVKSSERFLIDTRSSSLIVNGIHLQDTGQVSCVASNGAGQATESSFISILGESSAHIASGNSSLESITAIAKVAIQIGDSLYILSGSDVSIDCIARGTPPPVINWRWNGREVTSGERRGQLIITQLSEGSRLAIKQFAPENDGQYECIAINTGGADRITSSITALDGIAPKIEATSTSVERITDMKPISVQIGTRITLLPGVRLEITCPVSGIPEPSISWLRQGQQITTSGRFLVENDTLIIRTTALSDRGSFTCAANNTLGRTTSSTMVDITEPIKPRITETGKDLKIETIQGRTLAVGGNILCRDGFDLELTCTVQGIPTPEIVWLRGNKTVGTGFKLSLGILRENSSGDYTCLATNVGGEDRKTTKLNVKSAIAPVIESSSEVVESFEEGKTVVVDIGTRLKVVQGTKIDLICRVSGFPTPKVNWVKGNELLDRRFERLGFFVYPYNGTRSTLLIRGSQLSSDDEVYGCMAYNGGGSVTAFSYVTFYERVPPTIKSTWVTGSVGVKESLLSRDPIKVTIGDNVRLFTKTKLTIECPVFAIPVAKVQWTFNGGRLPSKHQQIATDLVLSEDSEKSDSGRYSCAATNPMGRDASWSDVTLIEPTLPTITMGESSVRLITRVEYTATIGTNITTLVGSNITFVCVSEGLPSPSLSWRKDDVALNFTNTLFTLYAMDTNATGVYSCVAENLAGFIVANSTVTIFDSAIETATLPRIITSRTNLVSIDDRRIVEQTVGGNVSIIEGRDLVLTCPVEGVPLPTTTWLFSGIPVEISDTLQIDEVTGNLKIIEMTPEDGGVYTCVATNIAGETSEDSYTTVIEPIFPVIDSSNVSIQVFDPTRKPLQVNVGSQVTTLTGTPVVITCNATGFPEPKISWVKGFTAITGSDAESLIVSKTKISLLRAARSDSGLYMCTASSPGGQAVAVSNITFVEPVKPIILFSTKEQEILQRVSVNLTVGEKLTILDKSNVTVECMARGMPPPSLTWSKNGVKLDISQASLLHLQSVTLEDVGRYTCTADNFLGFDSRSAVLSVRVGKKPLIKSKSQEVLVDDKVAAINLDIGSNLTLVAGSSVTVICEVEGVPDPRITWKQNGNQVLRNINKTSLNVENPDRINLHSISCTADNVLGDDTKTSYFTILELSKPVVKISDNRTTIEPQDRTPITMTIGDNVTALTNTSITIQCSTSGVPTPTVTWTKDGQGIPRDGRYTVQDDGSLLISEADEEDNARYTCTADNVAGEDSASSIVEVVEPQKPVIEVSASGQDIPIGDGSPVTMNIGDNVTAASNTTITIRCPVSGVPTPSVMWTKDGVQVRKGKSISIADDKSLVIKEAKIEDSARYTCSVESNFGENQSSSIVRIIAPSKPVIYIPDEPKTIQAQSRSPLTMTIGDNVTALTNTSITIQCPTSGAPTPTVTWAKDGQEIASGGRYAVQDDGSLLISEADEKDNARYTCIAGSVAGKDSASSTVRIVEPVTPMIEVPETARVIPVGDGSPVTMNIGDNVTAASNTTITIRCPVSGVPTPSVIWTKDGIEIAPEGVFTITDDNSLVIERADVDDSAKYTCSVQSKFGKDDISSTVRIKEPSKPAIDTSDEPKTTEAQDRSPITFIIGDNVTALTNTSITIQCSTSGVPTPTVTWTKDGLEMPRDGRYTVQDDGSLLISEANADDTSRYTCTAESVAGKDSASSMLQIVEPTKPTIDVPESGRDIPVGNGSPVTMNIGDNVTAASNTIITIQCPVSGIPTPSVIWTKGGVEIIPGDEFTITDAKSLVIEGAGVENSAEYTCSAENNFGRDDVSSTIRIKEPSKPAIDTSDELKTIEAQDRSPITLTIGDNVTALTNTSITIQCPTNGVPTPTVTWARNGQEIPSEGRYTIQGDSSLLIGDADEEDTSRFTCTADSVAGKDSASSTVQFIEPVKPMIEVPETGRVIPVGDGSPVTMNIGDNVTAASNTTITIKCPVSGKPTPSVTWTIGGVEITPGDEFTITEDNSLVIEGADVEDSSKYTCSVDSKFGKDHVSSTVNIKEPSKPAIGISDEPTSTEAQDRSPITLTIGDNVTALTNTSITIQCPTSGVPTPTVTWAKVGQEILSGGRYAIQEDGSLLISEADEEDSAGYTCTADSVAGKDRASSTVQIVEPAKPEIQVSEPGKDIPVGDGSPVTMNIGDNVTAASNTTITIRCPVSGVPKPSVTWKKDGILVIGGEKVSLKDDNSLVIKGAESSAKYTCVVESVAGTSSSSSVVKIIGPTKPVVKTSTKPEVIEAQDRSAITMTIGDNVTALTNTSITIQCPTSGVPTPTVTWTKDGQGIPKEGRYMVQDGLSLLISEADEEDNARYTCIAENFAGKDSAPSTVVVVEPVKPVIEVPESARDIPVGDGSPVTMNIGDNVTAASNTTITIRCPVSGVPTPSVTWTKDGDEIPPQAKYIITDDRALIVKGTDMQDSAKYTCSVHSHFGKDDSSSIVKILEPSKPVIDISDEPKTIEAQNLSLITLTIGDNVTALTNTSIAIQCATTGVPIPAVTWTKDGQELRSEGRYTIQDDGSLLISEADEEDNARYTCTADSVAGKHRASSTVQIVEPVRPTIEVHESGQDIPVGDGSPVTMNIGDNVTAASNTTITIRCPVSGVPKPSVVWKKDEVEIIPGEAFHVTDDNSLVIKGADLEENGKYSCTVRSEFGKDDISSIVDVIAPSKPAIHTPDEPKTIEPQDRSPITLTIGNNVTALTNTSITIHCATIGVPIPAVTWTKDGQKIPSEGRYTIQDDGSLLISEADEEDNARYTCTADNVAGKQSASSTVQIVEPVRPTIEVRESARDIPVGDGSPVTLNIGDNVTAASNTTITIRCPVSGVPTPSVIWTKDGIEIAPEEAFHVTDDNSLVIKGADLEDNGKYSCTVGSEFGKDDISSIVNIIAPSKPVVHTPDEPRAIEPQDRSPITMTIGNNVTALTNTSITIQCPTSGVPKPVVKWTKDGQEIPNEVRYTVQDDGSLLISEAEEEDSARYSCTADSVAGKNKASSTVQIVEPVTPVIEVPDAGEDIPVGDGSPVTMNIGDNVTAASNTTITIRCPVSGVPTPSVTWTKDGKEVAEGEKYFIKNGNVLVIKGAEPEDSAEYSCTVESKFGKETLSSIVRIKGPSKPLVKMSGKPTNIEAQDRSATTLTIGDNVTALTNTSITIQCPTSGVPTPTVTWAKDGQEIPIGGRFTVQDDGSLLISEVDEEDNARYTCTADNVAGQVSASSTVQIVEPVKPVIEVPESRRDIPVGDGSPMTMNIGDNVTAASNTTITIRCPVSGVPTPSVEWFKDDVQVTDVKQLFEAGNYSLVIERPEAEDSGKYTCRIQSFFGKEELLSVVTIIEPVLPQISSSDGDFTSLDQDSVNITIGQNLLTVINTKLSIKCTTKGIPIPKVTWTKGNETLPSDGRMTVRNGTLIMAELEPSDSGNYTCSSENSAGVAAVSSNVSVAVPTRPEIIRTGIKDVHVLEPKSLKVVIGSTVLTITGNNVSLSCRVKGFPTPSVQWTKDGVPLETETSTLILQAVDVKDSGAYMCTATSSLMGLSDSTSTNLTVIAVQSPTIITDEQPLEVLKIDDLTVALGGVITTLDGNRVSILCDVSGVPDPQITWEKDGAEVQRGGTSYTIETSVQSDSGNYSCIASNIAGKTKATSQLNVLVGSAPKIESSEESLVHMRIDFFAITVGSNLTTLASSGLEISCPATGFPKPVIRWYREGVPVQSGMMLNVDEDTGILFTLSISHRKGGTFTCEASNTLGSDKASSVIAVLAPEAPRINVSRSAIHSMETREPVSVRVGQTLSVLSGTNVSIDCSVSGVPKPDVTWSRDGRMLVKESLLTIANITSEDTGVYLCKAFNLEGEVAASSMINVTETSSPRIFAVDKSLKLLDSGSFAVDIGSNVTTVTRNALSIRCNATGVPTPQITWSKDGSLLDAAGPVFALGSLSSKDSGRYQCTASNIDGADVEDIQIIVLDGSQPEIKSPEENIVAVSGENEVTIMIGGNLTTVVGTGVKILCPVTALPSAMITWFVNGSAVEEENSRIFYSENGAVTMIGVTPEDVGSYTCVARNSYGSASKTTFLSLIIPVEPKILSSNKNIKDFKSTRHDLIIGDNVETLVGTAVYIRCPFTGNPAPVIEWKKSGFLLSTSGSLQIAGNTLILLDSTWSDTGSYTCEASNGAGSDQKESFLKFVAPEKPSIRGKATNVESYDRQPITITVGGSLTVLEKTTVNIHCTASGIPEPSVFWNSSSDMQPANKFDVNLGGQVLTIREVDASDSGKYMCSAVNKAGEVSEAAVLDVVEATVPKITTSNATVSWYNREPRVLPVGGTIEVLSGTKVTLTCKYSAFPEAEVQWSVLGEEGQVLEQDVGNEVTNGSLVLMALQPSDSAEYVCSVRNVAGTAQASTALKILVPQPPSISSSQDMVVSLSEIAPVQATVGSVVTVLSGTRITITCSADGVPTPTVAWSKGEDMIPTSSAGNRVTVKSGVLTIEDATTSDSGDYLCTAMSEVGVDQESTKATVIEPSKPIIQQPDLGSIPLSNKTSTDVPIGSDVTVLTQTRVNITCAVDGVPKPEIKWLRDAKPVESDTDSSLVLTISALEDAGQVTCVAENMAGNTTRRTDINVIEPILPRIKSEEGEIIALSKRRPVTASVGVTVQMFTGTSLTLECSAEGSPRPSVSWTKNASPLESKDRVSIKEDGTMIIRNTQVADTGRYMCLAKNAVGETHEASSVYVRAPIRPRIRKSRSYIIWYENQPFKGKIGDNLTTLKGRKLTLICPAMGLPQPAIMWYRGGMRMKSGGNYVAIGNTLIMFNLDPMDTDRYTCVARNFAGITSATTTLKVHEPMAPKIMASYEYKESLQKRERLNITIGNEASILQGSPLTIKCPVLGVPEPKIKWIKDRNMLSTNDRMEMDCAGILNIFKMELEDSGDYACVAESFLGMDMAFSAVTVFEAVKPSVEIFGRIYVSSGSIVDMHVGDNLTALATTPVNINCSAKGIPKPNILWQINGKQPGNGGNYKTDNNGALVIRGVQNKGEFKCIAQNFMGQDGASSFISLLDPVKPSIITPEVPQTVEAKDHSPITLTIGDNVTALTNTSITIQCPTSGVPTPTVTWAKDGQEISSEGRYTVQDDGSLLITDAEGKDNGRYTCSSGNVAGDASSSSTVKVVDPVRPVIEVPEPGQDIPVGDGSPVTMNIGDNVTAASNTTITIRCPVSGVPTPSVVWTKDEVEITPGVPYSITSDNSLVIEGAASDDSAEYTCSVKSVSGTDSESSIVKIIGPSKPVVKKSDEPKAIEAQNQSPLTMTIGDNVTALTNTSITIQCPTSGVPTPTVTWTKDDQEIPSEGRYMVQDDGSLLISEADEEDSARYTCIADSVGGKDSASSTVQIVEPAKPAIDVPESGKDIPVGNGSPVTMKIGDNVTAASNTTITIRCPVSGVPTPSVTWTKDGVEIALGGDYSVTSNNALVIEQATAEDSARYTCSVRSVTGTDSASSRVQIVEPLKPAVETSDEPKMIEAQDRSAITITIGDNVTALTNTSITIQCPTSGVPTPTVTWTKDGQEILSGGRYTLQDDGSLLISDAEEADNARYTCTADSVAGKDSVSSTVKFVEPVKPVIDVPKPGQDITVGDGSPVTMNIGDNVTAASNTTISITCPVSGVPTPSVVWTKDGDEISPGDNIVLTSENSLVIKQAEADDSAKYTCDVQGLTGSDSASSTIQIVEPSRPIVKVSDQPKTIKSQDGSPITLTIGDNVTALTNTSITIQCPTSGVPTPTVTWAKDDQEILSGGRYTIQDDGSLLISEANEEDNARYTCTADSVAGKDSASSTVEVIGLQRPRILVPQPGPTLPIGDGEPVVAQVGSQITELEYVKITLTCPTEGAPPPKIRWRKDGVDLVQGGQYLIDDKGSLTIEETLIWDSGNFTCSAENAAGVDEVTSSIAILEPFVAQIPPPKGSITSDDHRTVTAGVGSTINAFKDATIKITCAVQGVPKPEVSWTKDGQGISLGERVGMDSNGTLIIRDSLVEDSGEYTCTAKSRAGQTSSSSPLNVADTMHPLIVSQTEPVVWHKTEPLTATIGSSIQTLPGTQVSLSCPATGIPSPTLSWRKGNETLAQSGMLLTLGAVESENEGQYTCVATSIAGSAEASSDVTLEAPTQPSIERSVKAVSWDKESPLTVAVGSRVDIINGSSLILKCISSGLPPPELTWTRGIEDLEDDDKYDISKQTLTINNVQFEDSDEYTCTATNRAGQDAATTELVVKGPGGPVIIPDKRTIVDVNSSKPVIAPVGANITTIVNASVIMTCPNKGSPKPTVTWSHDQRFIVPSKRHFMNESSLVIRGVRLQDEGSYQCTASNLFGRDAESLSLTITVPPLISNVKGSFEITDIRDLISITTGAVVTIPRGVSVRINCLATGVPTPTITWYRRVPGMKERHAVVLSHSLKLLYDGSLSITNSAINDAAYYICVASNIAGKDEGSTLLNIGTPPEIPSHWRGVKSRFNIPEHTRRTSTGAVAAVVRGATLHIKCAVEGTPKPQITWEVSTSSQEQRHTVLDDGTLVVPSAELEDEGNYTCIANNSYGTLRRTTSVSILVPPEILDRHLRHVFNEKRIEGYAMAHAEVKRNTISSLSVERGYNLILICTVVGKPSPHITWRRNGELLKNDSRHLLLPNGVLLVRQVETRETGQYKCIAKNIVGKDEGSVKLTVKNEATGYWKTTAWSNCGNCVTHLRGWQERHISCMGPGGKAISDLHCLHKHKPIKRRRCTHRDCHVIWRTTAWSACSRSCGSHGVKLRNLQCVFAKSLKPAKGQCGWQKQPPLQEPCNRKPCRKGNCVDEVKYCQRVKQIGMCPVYSRWCCNTCR